MNTLEEIRRRLESGRYLYDSEFGWIERGTPEYAKLMRLRVLEGERKRAEDAAWAELYADIEQEAARLGMTPGHLLDVLRYPAQVRKAYEALRPPSPPKIETKYAIATLEVKSGLATLTGYLSVFGDEDAQGDVVERGAFKKTIAEATARPLSARFLLPVLLQHDPAKPVGGFKSLSENVHGLAFVAELDTKTRDGADAYSAVKAGYLSGLSIGFITRQANFDAAGTRHLTDIKLMEGSLVTFPANDRARISSVN